MVLVLPVLVLVKVSRDDACSIDRQPCGAIPGRAILSGEAGLHLPRVLAPKLELRLLRITSFRPMENECWRLHLRN